MVRTQVTQSSEVTALLVVVNREPLCLRTTLGLSQGERQGTSNIWVVSWRIRGVLLVEETVLEGQLFRKRE